MLSPRNKGAAKRFREPFGKAGLTVAILALVFAMVGGAWAAAGLNSKQKKEVKSIAKSFQGTGPAGAAGPAGAKGDNGSNGAAGVKGDKGDTGATGKQGTQGIQGKEGSPWTAGGTLPSGQTETGTWNALATGAWYTGPVGNISFALPLKAGAEKAAFVFTPTQLKNGEFGKEEGKPEKGCKVGDPECVDTGCRGGFTNPTAPKGVLCVYAQYEEMSSVAGEPGGLYADSDGEGARGDSYGPAGTFIAGIGGFAAEAYLAVYGTWAVTAP